MSMGKNDAPPAPDYTGAAQQQGVANLEAARVGARLSNPNIRTPLGNRTVTYGDNNPVFDQAGYDAAMQAYQQGLSGRGGDVGNLGNDTGAPISYGSAGTAGTAGSLTAPTREQFTTYGNPDQSNVDITLSPEQQRLFAGQNRLSEGMLGLGQGALERVQGSLGGQLDTSGLPPWVRGIQGGQIPEPGLGIRGRLGPAGPIQGNVDIPGRAGVEDAMYKRATARLDPMWQQRTAAVENKLTNQGLRPGTEAWDNAMRNESFARNDAYSSAMNDAILAGGNEQSRLFGLNLGQGQFANQAQGQGFGQGLAGGQFQNAAQAQGFGQGLQGQGQLFNQGLAGGQFQNQTRQGALQEALALRQLPLSEFNAIRTGSQPQMPQFQPYQGTGVQPAPIFQGAMAQGQANQGAYNAGQAQQGNFLGGLMSLGGAAMGSPWFGGLFG